MNIFELILNNFRLKDDYFKKYMFYGVWDMYVVYMCMNSRYKLCK